MPVGALVPVGAGAVSLGLSAVLVGLLPVLLDVAPAKLRLLVMQPSCPVVCLDRPAARLGGPVPFPLYVSVGSLLELRRATHLVGRTTGRGLRAAAYPIAVIVHFQGPSLSFVNVLGGVSSTVIGLTRRRVCLWRPAIRPGPVSRPSRPPAG
jgi:hypothetical protein